MSVMNASLPAGAVKWTVAGGAVLVALAALWLHPGFSRWGAAVTGGLAVGIAGWAIRRTPVGS
ncbi:MAG: hypothetical protein ABMB14_26920, partial [Myxococcota bacterium]